MQSDIKQKWWFCILTSFFVIIFDQASKFSVLAFLSVNETLSICPFLNITLIFNRGTSFGLLSPTSGTEQNIVIAITIFCILLLLIFFLYSKKWSEKLLTSLLIGGAIGNLIDRFLHGAVVDFIDVFYKDWHWPAFNIADSFICMSAVLLLLLSCRNR